MELKTPVEIRAVHGFKLVCFVKGHKNVKKKSKEIPPPDDISCSK
jgi:hypothetical protein